MTTNVLVYEVKMENKNLNIEEKKNNKGLAIKIAIPIIIVLVVAGIWIAKNVIDKDNDDTQNGTGNGVIDPLFEFETTTEIDLETLKSYGLPILIDFGTNSDACTPCKNMKPEIKQVYNETNGKAIVIFVDVWEYPALAKDYPVSVIPTQLFINSDGTPYVPSEEYEKSMKIYNSKSDGEHTFTTHEGGLTRDEMISILTEMGMK